MRIREATLEDVPHIWKLIKSSFQSPHSEFMTTSQGGYELYLQDFVISQAAGPKGLFVADVQGMFAGFADITRGSLSPNFLTRIGVSQYFRGQGIAGQMLTLLADNYVTNNHWELDVVTTNTPALSLYEKLGFTVASTRKWIGRVLPDIVSPAGEMADVYEVPTSDPKYERYGFTMVSVDGEEFGIVGNAVRCNSSNQFLDNEKIMSLKAQFPSINHVFVIIDKDDRSLDGKDGTAEIIRTHRMAGKL